MRILFFASLMIVAALANRSVAAAPPEQLPQPEVAGVYDAETLLALRDLARAQLKVEAAAELTTLAVQALRSASNVPVPMRHVLAGWLGESKRIRAQLSAAPSPTDPTLSEDAQRRHAALQQAFNHWQLGANKHAAAIEELLQQVTAADEAQARAQEGAADAQGALSTLLGLHRQAAADVVRAKAERRAASAAVKLAARQRSRGRRLPEPGVKAHEAWEEGAQPQPETDLEEALLQRRLAAQAQLKAVEDLEHQRRLAMAHGQHMVGATESGLLRLQREYQRVVELSGGRVMARLLRGREQLNLEQSQLLDELNGLREMLADHAPLVGSAAAAAPILVPEAELTTAVVATAGTPSGARLPESPGVTAARTIPTSDPASAAVARTQALLPASEAPPELEFAPQTLSKADYRRARKPAGELLKGGAAGGLADQALLQMPELLRSIRILDPTFGQRDVAYSGRNRVFWLADGRQILLLTVCRTLGCRQHTYVIAYDRMKEQAALIRRDGTKLELVGHTDEPLRALLLWYYRQRQRRPDHSALATR